MPYSWDSKAAGRKAISGISATLSVGVESLYIRLLISHRHTIQRHINYHVDGKCPQ